VLDLKRRNGFTAADVENVRCDVFQGAFEFAGGGSFGAKDLPQVKEQGYYNLKYLIAAALLDDQLGLAQLDEARIQAPDAQALLMRVEIRPDQRFGARYPDELSARVTIRTKDQRVVVKEQNGYERGLTNPMSWERTVERFHWLAEAFADEGLRSRIIGAIERLDTSELSDLTDLLAQVQPIAVFPTTHPGIQ
jgi:2-methylcitrate dehydratase